MTGLEPATAWSQTRNATNCATPRSAFCGCKGTQKSEKLKAMEEENASAWLFLTIRYLVSAI